ncbi:hypothetical protein MKW94_005024 [Papaver nudicaule]|uniref:Uncharacterized protein n=1 Tax=Papaver nudicaule TaxID=74823 RepID=A0AA41W1W3_PAPNU|nr:hypothetical protein [Papaver nudicaule]
MASSLFGVSCNFLIVGTITATAAAVHKDRAKPPTEFKVGGILGWYEPDANHTDMSELWATGGALDHCKNGRRLLIDLINLSQTSSPSLPPPPTQKVERFDQYSVIYGIQTKFKGSNTLDTSNGIIDMHNR